MIQAIIDVGSNTVRMAIYTIEAGAENKAEMLMKKKDMVGLAGYVKDEVMQQEGIDSVCKVLLEYRKFLDRLSIDRVTAFTTAALRNCRNSGDAVAEIVERTGIPLKVISGDEEAEYDFVGATHDTEADTGLVMDIGGGSTELVYYENRQIVSKVSLPIGSLGYRSQYVSGLFPTVEEIEVMRGEVKKALRELKGFENIRQQEICGIGGTFKGAAAIFNEICHEQGRPTSNSFGVNWLKKMLERFCNGKLKQADTLILLRAIPERLETVLPGVVIADVLAEAFGCTHITYSDSGVREGFIYKEIMPNL